MADELVRIGSLLADPTRAQILVALMDGRARTGSELARHVGVAASTVSEHLGRLLDESMVRVEPQGRHRYWRLAGPSVAELLEALGANAAAIMPASPRAPASLTRVRTCYDHLAGELAVTIFDRLVADEHLVEVDDRLVITSAGTEYLASLGVDVAAIRNGNRPPARPCLDWTERTHHLGGSSGRALYESFQSRGWIRRGQRPRSVEVTSAGRIELHRRFGWTA